MILVGDLIIRCSSCGAKYAIDTDSLDADVSYIGEGGMGEQYETTSPWIPSAVNSTTKLLLLELVTKSVLIFMLCSS